MKHTFKLQNAFYLIILQTDTMRVCIYLQSQYIFHRFRWCLQQKLFDKLFECTIQNAIVTNLYFAYNIHIDR